MARKKNKNLFWNNFWNILWVIVFIGIISFGIYAWHEGWFTKIVNQQTVQVYNQTIQENEAPEFSNCNQLCSSNDFSKSYSINKDSACKPGENKVTYGYPNKNPLLVCCCFNEGNQEDEDKNEQNQTSQQYYTDWLCQNAKPSGIAFHFTGNSDYTQSSCNQIATQSCGNSIATDVWFDKNCCAWNCEYPEWIQNLYDQEECQDYADNNGYTGYYRGFSVSSGGIDWTDNTCESHANSDCYGYQENKIVDSYKFDKNCCIWKCKTNINYLCYDSCKALGYGTGKDILITSGTCSFADRQDTCREVGGVNRFQILNVQGGQCCCWCCHWNVKCTS